MAPRKSAKTSSSDTCAQTDTGRGWGTWREEGKDVFSRGQGMGVAYIEMNWALRDELVDSTSRRYETFGFAEINSLSAVLFVPKPICFIPERCSSQPVTSQMLPTRRTKRERGSVDRRRLRVLPKTSESSLGHPVTAANSSSGRRELCFGMHETVLFCFLEFAFSVRSSSLTLKWITV